MQKPSLEAPSPKATAKRPAITRLIGLQACGKEKYNVIVLDEDVAGVRVGARVVESNLSLGPAMGAVLVETGRLKNDASKLWQGLVVEGKAK